MFYKKKRIFLPLVLLCCILLGACAGMPADTADPALYESAKEDGAKTGGSEQVTLAGIPDYGGDPYIILDDNIPGFTKEDKKTEPFETYSELDALRRCGTAYANVCTELMPSGKRQSISAIKPSGWQVSEYDFIDGKYLYNRCHLIAYQLAGENANEKNLITGTRYMNVDGMLPFENEVADYVKETKNHVLYRVTPIFLGDNLIASGVEMEAWSVEDEGDGVCFHVYVYNVQPGVRIDYATGENGIEEEDAGNDVKTQDTPGEEMEYVLNTNTYKFHLPSCESAADINIENRASYTGSRNELIGQGYAPCKRCNP